LTVEEEVLGRVVAILESLSVPYMITGSIAAAYHGRPRATHDADVVIDPTETQLEQFEQQLDAQGFYVDADRAREALRRRLQFNAIETRRATKVDLIVRKARPFSVEEFGRRIRADMSFARNVCTVTPEDSVLSKLEWARQGGDSERQIRDAAGVVELNPMLDRQYVRRWALELGVADLWSRIDT